MIVPFTSWEPEKMGKYLSAVWHCRFFLFSLVKKDLRTRYRRSVLGIGWSLMHPVAMATILCLVFHHLLHADVWHYGPYLLAGLACWNYILTSTSLGCQSLFMAEMYMRQQAAPIAIYPLRTTLGATIHFLLALVVVTLLMWFVKGSRFHVAALLSLPPTVLMLFVFCWSLAVLAAIANVLFQDTQHLCEVGFQVLFYLTPIMYEPGMLGNGRIVRLIEFNPLTPLLHLIREPIVEGHVPDLVTYAKAGVMVFLMASAAMFMLARFERRVIFYM